VCDNTSSRKLEEVPFVERNGFMSVHAAATEAVEMAVSSRGDVVFMWDARLYFYSSQLGYFHTDGKYTKETLNAD
jgi:hypothetical protein